MKTAWELIAATFNQYWDDKAQRLGAALAYYAAFSLAPCLLLIVSIADIFYSQGSLTHIHSQISATIGVNAADAIVATMRALQATSRGGVAMAVSIVTLLIGASAAFGSLQDAMNTIWEVTPKPRHIIADFLRTRLLSFVMVLCLCVILMVSLLSSTALAATGSYLEARWPVATRVWVIADFILTFLLTTLGIAAIYKVLPDVRLAWSDVWIGAASTAALFTLGKIPIAMYLGQGSFSSAYGAAASGMIILAWVYYSSQILFLGAEFTKVYANRFGSHLRPARGAIILSDLARIQQGIPRAATVREAIRDASERQEAS